MWKTILSVVLTLMLTVTTLGADRPRYQCPDYWNPPGPGNAYGRPTLCDTCDGETIPLDFWETDLELANSNSFDWGSVDYSTYRAGYAYPEFSFFSFFFINETFPQSLDPVDYDERTFEIWGWTEAYVNSGHQMTLDYWDVELRRRYQYEAAYADYPFPWTFWIKGEINYPLVLIDETDIGFTPAPPEYPWGRGGTNCRTFATIVTMPATEDLPVDVQEGLIALDDPIDLSFGVHCFGERIPSSTSVSFRWMWQWREIDPPPPVREDVDGSGNVNAGDIGKIASSLVFQKTVDEIRAERGLGPDDDVPEDVNLDGYVNIGDIAKIASSLVWQKSVTEIQLERLHRFQGKPFISGPAVTRTLNP